MKRSLFGRALSLLVLAPFLFSPFASASAAGEPPRIVPSGDTRAIDESEIAITPQSGSKGSLSIVQKNGKFQLMYAAPTVKENFEDTATYKVGEVSKSVPVVVTVREDIGFAPGTHAYEAGFKALFVLFVLAVVLESALAPLFNWRPFVETFNARAVKPLVSFVVAMVFVHLFKLDIVSALVDQAGGLSDPPKSAGSIMTALVIAGGSSGINNLLTAFGYRQQRTPETVSPKPPPESGWISVKVNRKKAVGPIYIYMGAVAAPPLVFIISPEARTKRSYFLADASRFPPYGGHLVKKDTEVQVVVKADPNLNNGESFEQKPAAFIVGAGAIIDLEVEL